MQAGTPKDVIVLRMVQLYEIADKWESTYHLKPSGKEIYALDEYGSTSRIHLSGRADIVDYIRPGDVITIQTEYGVDNSKQVKALVNKTLMLEKENAFQQLKAVQQEWKQKKK